LFDLILTVILVAIKSIQVFDGEVTVTTGTEVAIVAEGTIEGVEVEGEKEGEEEAVERRERSRQSLPHLSRSTPLKCFKNMRAAFPNFCERIDALEPDKDFK